MALTTTDLKAIQKIVVSTEKKLMTRMDSTQRDLAGRMLDAVQKMIDYAVNGMEDRLSKKISHLPTKEEFFDMEDKVVGELQKTREEHIVIQGQVFRHTDEIMSLQDIHPDNNHSFAN